jgi:hypothetical protein
VIDMDEVVRAMKAAGGIKNRMKDRGLVACKCTCPRCNQKSAAVARLAGPRQHLHMSCTKCSFVLME